MDSILTVLFTRVGSGLLLAPALAALRRRHPHARIELAGHPWRLRLLEHPELADRVWSIPGPEAIGLAGPSSDPPLGLDAFDAVVLFTVDPGHPGVARWRAVLGDRLRVECPYPAEGAGVHLADHLQRAFRHLGVSGGADRSFRLPLAGGPASARTGRLVYLHAGTTLSEKLWPAERWIALARRLADHGARLLLGSGPLDEETNRPIEAGLADLPIERAAGRSIAELARVLAGADLAVGVDSGPTHLAALLGVPTVAIYGPARPETWGPLGRRVKVLAGSCGLVCCAEDHVFGCQGGCTARVGLDAVLAAALEFLHAGSTPCASTSS